MMDYFDHLVQEGDEHFIEGEFEKALMCYQKSEEQGNGSALLCYRIADTVYHLGKLDEALEQCRQGISIYPESPELWEFMGKLLVRLEKMMEALEAYRNAAKYTLGKPGRKLRRTIEWLEELTAGV